MPVDRQVIQRWTGSAPFWEKHSEIIRQMFHPVTLALAEDAQVSGCGPVLDIASGAGEPALTLAGLAGTIAGIDAVPRMAAAASRAAGASDVRNAFFCTAFADQLPFLDDVFDAAVCRFGAMFFPSPEDALREILRVLKPGRRVAFAVWSSPESNPFFTAVAQVLNRYVEAPPPPPDALDGFRFAVPGKLKRILDEAGAAETGERIFQFPVTAPVSVEEYWVVRYEMSETLQEKVMKIPVEQWPEVQRQLFESIGNYVTEDGISMPAEVLIVSGRKPDR